MIGKKSMLNNYLKVADGHWYQEELTGPLPDYSKVYSQTRYDTYSTNDIMSKVRFELIKNKIGQFKSICDFGYGNGAFLKYCINHGNLDKIYGYDISDYETPNGAKKIQDVNSIEVDVMTFFDSLEHLTQKNLEPFLSEKNIKHICVSVPWFHESQGAEWFKNWKHRRENEHIHHFDTHGLINLLISSGYKIIHVGNDEDVVRTPVSDLPNILTVIATKK